MYSTFALWIIPLVFHFSEGNRHRPLHRPMYYNDENRSFSGPPTSFRQPFHQRHSTNGLHQPLHHGTSAIDQPSELAAIPDRELDPSAIIFDPPPTEGFNSEHRGRTPSKNWSLHLLLATTGHPSSNHVLLSNVTETMVQDWFTITTNPNNFHFDVRGSCICWLVESFEAINCLTNETLTTDTPKEFRIPINKLDPYFRINYVSTHVYFSGPGPQDFSLLSIRSGRYLTFPIPDPGPQTSKRDIFVIDTLRNLLVWFDYIYFKVKVQPLHQLQSKVRRDISIPDGANTQPKMTLDEKQGVLYMFVELKLLRVKYLEEATEVEQLYKLKNKWNPVIFNFMYSKENLLWATWSVPEMGKNVTNLWMEPASGSEPPTGILNSRPRKAISGKGNVLGFRAFGQEAEDSHEPAMSPQQQPDFVFPRDPWVLNLPLMNKTDAFLVSCPVRSQLVRISNGTDVCEDDPVGMSWTMIVGYIVAPLVILIPALMYLGYLLTTICKRRSKRYSTA